MARMLLNELKGEQVRKYGRYRDPALARDEAICVRVRRVRSYRGSSSKKIGNLNALRLYKRSPGYEDHLLTRQTASHLRGVSELLDTEVVLPKGHTVSVDLHEVLRIAEDEPRVNTTPYEVDGQPAISIDWSTGDHSRIERYDGFTLFAWSTRLSPTEALALLQAESDADAKFVVFTSSDGVLESTTDSLEQAYVRSRADRVRLLRVENGAATLLWEVSGIGRGRVAPGDTHFVVMAPDASHDEMLRWIERTATARIVLARHAVLNAAAGLGAL